MSALNSKKQFLLLPLIAALLVGAFALFKPSTSDVDLSLDPAPKAVSSRIASIVGNVVPMTTHSEVEHSESHREVDEPVVRVRSQVTTVSSLDGLFKHFQRKGALRTDRDAFSFAKGARKGDQVHFDLDGQTFSGEIVAVRVAEDAHMSAVHLSNPEGRVVTSYDRNGDFSAYIVYKGESRALKVSEFDYKAQADDRSINLEVVSVSDIFCGPKDMVYGGASDVSHYAATLLASDNTPGDSAEDVTSTPKLTNVASQEYVVYLDFDGASIIDDPNWGSVEALSHSRAKDSQWVTAVWERVVEDFAPFDLTITTDRTVFNNASETKRLQVIVTPTDDVAPGEGGAGIPMQFGTVSPIAWVFNLEEYATADTISHEIGHAMGLSHDGVLSGLGDQYYGGHGGTGVTSWAPIMGAAWNENYNAGYYEFVTQWSQGEYTDADNQEDDLAIIGGPLNGFGFRSDDWADSLTPGATDPVLGGYVVDADGNFTGSGIIGTSSDIDVFRIAMNPGLVNLVIAPLDVMSTANETGSDRPGANLAVNVRLLDSAGNVRLAVANQNTLFASINYFSFGEVLYLEVSGGSRGNDPTVGFSDYASVGHYSITGTIPPEPMAVSSKGGKLEIPILNGETATSTDDGTDFGFSTPARLVTNDFNLENLSTETLTVVSITFASGTDFEVVSAPTEIAAGGTASLTLGYRPDSIGVFSDTVIISYDSELPESQTYEFALSGTATSTLGVDNYENNDALNSPYQMTNHEDIYLSDYLGLAYQDDVSDWYQIIINADDDFITADFSYDATGLSGPLQITLKNSTGVVKATALGTTGSEKIGFVIPEDYVNLVYYIHVKGPVGVNVSDVLYDFKWSAQAFTGVDGDDLYEENDFQIDAFDLGTGAAGSILLSELLGPGVQFDDDWYKITVPQDPYIRMIYIGCEYDSDEGNIAIDLSRRIDSVDQNLLTSDSQSGYEWVNYTEVLFVGDLIPAYDPEADPIEILWSPVGNTAVAGVEPGDYYIRVRGDDVGQVYDLQIGLLSDDNYEVVGTEPSGDAIENDSEDDAYDLGDEIVGQTLSSINGFGMLAAYRSEPGDEIFENAYDEDWYEFNFNRTDVNQVVIDFSNLGVNNDYIGAEIRTLDGALVASYKEKDSSVSEFTLTIDNPTKGTYLIGVMTLDVIAYLTGYDFAVELNYDALIVEDAVEDNYEQNDDFEHPFNLQGFAGIPLIAVDGAGTLLDPDWYEIVVPVGGSNLVIECTYASDDASLELALIRADKDLYGKKTLATFESTVGESATVTWESPDPGLYRIGVVGDYVGTSYDLVWSLRRTEDNYESNPDADNAFDLTGHERRFLHKLDGLGVQANEDWYRIAARADTEELRVDLYFSNAEGDIDIELYAEDGERLDRSVTSTDNESIAYAFNGIPEAGYYYVLVTSFGVNPGNEYDLAWAALDASEVLLRNQQDAYEENDSLAAAYPLTAEEPRLLNLLGLGNQSDEDFYSITILEGNVELYVECLFSDAESDIDLELYDESGVLVSRQDGVTDDEIIDIQRSLAAGTYYLRVYGPSFGNEYDLYWLAKTEDIYEENDSKNDAYDITSQSGQPLSALGVPTQGDDDWYAIDVTGNYPYIQVTLDYTHINGSIDFDVRDSTGNNVLITADSTADSQTVFIPVNTGINYIKVYGDNEYNPYDLTWELFNDDIYELNNSSAAAADISDESTISGVQFDDDWYWFDSTDSNTFLSVVVNFTHAAGNIDLEVYESTDLVTPIATSATTDDVESVSLPGGTGVYYIKLTGDNLNPAYQLFWGVSDDDDYEENDTPGTAANITSLAGVPLDAFQFDADWFRVSAEPGNVKLTVDIEFSASEGNLNLSLYNEFGTGDPLMSVDSATDNESLVYPLDPYAANEVTYLVKVDGGGAGTDYDLIWEVSNEDNFEGETGNNGIGDASDDLLDVEGQRISGTIGYAGALNDDWYTVRINPGDEGIVVEASFVHSDSTNIDLDLYNASGSRVARSIGYSDVERIHYTGGEGDYYLRVFGSSGENPYDLIWNSYKEDNLELGVEGADKKETDTPDNDSPDTPRGLQRTEYNETVGYAGTGGGSPDLEFFLLEDLTLLDEDWYAVEVEAGEDVFIVDLQFVHASGDIDVAVYDRDTGTRIAFSDDQEDGEYLRLDGANALVPGDYLICVYGYGIVTPKAGGWLPGDFNPYADDYSTITPNTIPGENDYYELSEKSARGLANTYSLQWVSSTEDDYDEPTVAENDVEVNDSFAKAKPAVLIDQEGILDAVVVDELRSKIEYNDDLEPQTVEYRPIYNIPHLAQFDEDWFEVSVDTGGVHDFFASIIFNALHGNLDLFVYDESGNLLDSSTSETSYAEIIEVNGTGAVTYYLQVVGNNLGVPYDLSIRGFFDDPYEENDTITEAQINADLSDWYGFYTGDIFVLRDVDLYRIEVPVDQVHLYFQVISGVNQGIAFDVEVLDSFGNPLPSGFEVSGGSTSLTDNYSAGVIAPEAGVYYLSVSGSASGLSYGIGWDYDNIDEYDGFSGNDTPTGAEDLTRFRLEPVYVEKDPGPLSPIKEFAFNYDLLNNLTVGTPFFDPFGHAIQEGEDWYSIQIPSWTLATAKQGNQNISVLKRLYYARLSAEIEFVNDDGDINIEIYDEDDITYDLLGDPVLGTPLARSATENDIETVFAAIDPLDQERVYYIRVYGENKANDYSLKWDVSTDDAYEKLENEDLEDDTNNFLEIAYDLTRVNGVSTEGLWLDEILYPQDVNGDGDSSNDGFTSPHGYGIQTSSDDWYAVVVSEGATQITVDCEFHSDNDQGYDYKLDDLDIDFEVYFLAGNDEDDATYDLRKPVLIGRSILSTDDTLFTNDGSKAEALTVDVTTKIEESATFAVSEKGIYLIRIYYDGKSHPYRFKWDDFTPDDAGDDAIIMDYHDTNWGFVPAQDLPNSVLNSPLADADGDDLPNWAEFALGLDPSVPDYAIIGQSVVEIDGKNYYQFEFLRTKEAVAYGYEFIVEETATMVFDGSEAVYVGVEDVTSDIERVFYRCSESMDVQDKCFFRLTVNEPVAKD